MQGAGAEPHSFPSLYSFFSVPGITKELAKEIVPAIAKTPSRKTFRKERQEEDYKCS